MFVSVCVWFRMSVYERKRERENVYVSFIMSMCIYERESARAGVCVSVCVCVCVV